MLLPNAMPMLAVMRRRPGVVSSSSNGSRITSSRRSATNSGLPVGDSPSTSTTNSSPPRRAIVSASLRVAESRVATACSSRSPVSWPRVSLTCLKPSRSMNKAALSVPVRRARASICSTRSRMSARLGNPVSESCNAWCRMLSSKRALRMAIVAWLARPRSRFETSGSSHRRSGRSVTSPTTRPTGSPSITIGMVATAAAAQLRHQIRQACREHRRSHGPRH